jgi:hypothetical protein
MTMMLLVFLLPLVRITFVFVSFPSYPLVLFVPRYNAMAVNAVLTIVARFLSKSMRAST